MFEEFCFLFIGKEQVLGSINNVGLEILIENRTE